MHLGVAATEGGLPVLAGRGASLVERAWACLGRVRGRCGGLGRGYLGGCLGHLGGCGHWFAYRKKRGNVVGGVWT